MKVIMDSNFLCVPSKFRVDIFDELIRHLNQRVDPILLSATYQELLKMVKHGSPKLRKQGELALKLAEKCRIIHFEQSSRETHDDLIVRVAKKWNCPVATNDRELRKKLRKEHVLTIFLRQGTHLASEGVIH